MSKGTPLTAPKRQELIKAVASAKHSRACDDGYTLVGHPAAEASVNVMWPHIEALTARVAELRAENKRLCEALSEFKLAAIRARAAPKEGGE